jgi:hypothetical protein
LFLAFFLLRIPVGGWAGFSWIRVLEPRPSVITTILLLVGLHDRCVPRPWFRSGDWLAVWIFGAVASLILYPMGLGLTPTDPYSWGWINGSSLPALIIGLCLIVAGSRFGFALLAGGVATASGLEASANAWDILIDPPYAIVSLLAVIVIGIRAMVSSSLTR